MTAKVDIMNKAINLLGEAYINSPTQAVKAASRANQEYDLVRDACLRAHPWNFATKRRQLAANANSPVSHWTYAFPLPADCIRVLSVSDSDLDYVGEEGPKWEIGLHGDSNLRCVFFDSDECYVRYTMRITDENIFDPLFVKAFAASLAAEIAYSLTQDRSIVNDMMGIYNMFMRQAKSVDSQEGGHNTVIDDEWLKARR